MSHATGRVVPDSARSTQGLSGSAGVDRKGPKRSEDLEASLKHDGDEITAAWFDAALTMYGKATSYSELMSVDLNHVRRWRTGEKAVPLRAVLPFKGNTEAVLAFVADLLDSIGYVARPVKGPTRAELAERALRIMEQAAVTHRLLVDECQRTDGWTSEQCAMALRNDEDDQ